MRIQRQKTWWAARVRTLGWLLVSFVASGNLVMACPSCKDSLGANSANLVRGFGWSIIFMMSAPFLTFLGIGAYFYYEVRKARHNQRHMPARASAAFDRSNALE